MRAYVKKLSYLKNGKTKSIAALFRVQKVKRGGKRNNFFQQTKHHWRIHCDLVSTQSNTLDNGTTAWWKKLSSLCSVFGQLLSSLLWLTSGHWLSHCAVTNNPPAQERTWIKRSSTTTFPRIGRKVSETRWHPKLERKHRKADKKGKREPEGPCYQFVMKIYFFIYIFL